MIVLGNLNGNLALTAGTAAIFSLGDNLQLLIINAMAPLSDALVSLASGPVSTLLVDVNAVGIICAAVAR